MKKVADGAYAIPCRVAGPKYRGGAAILCRCSRMRRGTQRYGLGGLQSLRPSARVSLQPEPWRGRPDHLPLQPGGRTRRSGTALRCRTGNAGLERLGRKATRSTHRVRHRALYPVSWTTRRAGDDVLPGPFRQRARVQVVQGYSRTVVCDLRPAGNNGSGQSPLPRRNAPRRCRAMHQRSNPLQKI